MAASPDQPSHEEFDALYRGHVGDVYRYSLSLVRDPVDAEDVTQTTFLNAYRAFAEAPPRKPRPWLIAIARNVCLERYRQSQRRPQQVTLHDVAATPADEVGVRSDEILDALRGVPSRQRAALLLDGLEGRSRAEIAAALGIGEATVTGLLTRGRNNLRLQLDEGMSCDRARAAAPVLWGKALPRGERRAAIAHLRNCEHCSAAGFSGRTASGLLGTLWFGLRDLTEPLGRFFSGSTGLGGSTIGLGSSLAAKAIVVGVLGVAAGGIAWHETNATGASRQPAPRPATAVTAHTSSRPAAGPPKTASSVVRPSHGRPAALATAAAPPRPVASASAPASSASASSQPATGTSLPPATVPATAAHDAPAATLQGHESTVPASTGHGAGEQHRSTESAGGGPVSDAAQAAGSQSASVATGSQSASVATGSQEASGKASAPGQLKRTAPAPVTTAGRENPAGKAPPGQADVGHGNSSAAHAAAPGKQDDNPGQRDHGQGTQPQGNAGGQATAPGQVDNPGQGSGSQGGGNAGSGNTGSATTGTGVGQATPPGLVDNPGQGSGTPGNGTAGNGNQGSGGDTTPAPAALGNAGLGNAGLGNAGLGDPGQGNPGQGGSGGHDPQGP